MAETGRPPPLHSQGDTPARPQKEETERFLQVQEQFISPREASDIRIRERISWAVIVYYGVLLASTIPIFYLQGSGVIALSDPVIMALSGVLVGNTAAGALFLHVIKGMFQ